MIYIWQIGNCILFSTAAAPFYIPTNDAQGFPDLPILANTCYILFVYLLFCLFFNFIIVCM